MISFDLIKGSNAGPRAGILKTPHGDIPTPCFMAVGSVATVKAMAPWDLKDVGSRIILSNTYHVLLRPGIEVIKAMGGLHKFMGWDGAILTDSGGYQVVSLSGLVKLEEEGVEFRSHVDGAKMRLTPESVVAAQRDLGVDIAMVLDQPLKLPAKEKDIVAATEKTARWAKRSREYRDTDAPEQAVFGIVQGGTIRSLREWSVGQTVDIGFDGYAVGGLSVGEGPDDLHETTSYTAPLLPADKPRYLMGVGRPQDLIMAVANGVDMFDCVLPTRNARNGWIYTSRGAIRIKQSAYRLDPTPPDPDCDCAVCRNFSRAYLRHLYLADEMLAGMLITRHNLAFYLRLMRRAREEIIGGGFERFAKETLAALTEANQGKGA